MWKRYRFCTYSVNDYRPLIFNPKFPWWCNGFSDDDKSAIIIAYLPNDENLLKYWNDAFNIEFEDRNEIIFTSRFPKPSYFVESSDIKIATIQ